jgi:hypothetical protein
MALLLAATVFAQGRGGFGAGRAGAVANAQAPGLTTYGSRTGFGNVVFPGTGHAPNAPPFSITNPGFASQLGATVGVGGFHGFGNGFGRGHGGVIAVPFAYPVIVGGGYSGFGYGYDSGYGYPAAPYPPQAYPPQPYPVQPYSGPQVIINQTFLPETARPVVREYTPENPSGEGTRPYEAPARPSADADASDNGTNFYLIAFKDHSIYSAYAYWIEGDTLHYVTAQRAHNQVSLDLVDRELTQRLNRNRNLQVKLP